jgi:hypothetical protein
MDEKMAEPKDADWDVRGGALTMFEFVHDNGPRELGVTSADL